MTHRKTFFTLATSLLAMSIGGLGATAQAALAPERFALGANANGDACSASRQWGAGAGPISYAADQPFVINCRDIAAADLQGYVSARGKPAEATTCGEAVAATIAGNIPAQVRRCFDPRLGKPAIDIRITARDGSVWQGAAVESALGVLETALGVIAMGATPPQGNQTPKSAIQLAALPPAPAAKVEQQGQALSPANVLTDGVIALQSGRLLDASRTLSDGLRAFANADPTTRADLRLAAGLAHSNLTQFELAAADFAVADGYLRDAPPSPQRSLLMNQLGIYRGIDLVNQHRWNEAIAELNRMPGTSAGGIEDPETLSRLNQEGSGRGSNLQSQLSNDTDLNATLLKVQRYQTLSVAYLGAGRVDEAGAALQVASGAANAIVQRYAPDNIAWLRTTLERQQARIYMRRNTARDIARALDHYDCAIAGLSGRTSGTACLFPNAKPLSDTYVAAPLLADTQLERASAASRNPAISSDKVLAEYANAVQSLPQLTGTGNVSLASIERYFALLTRAPATPERDDRFFQAMQMIGEPAIALEYAQLQRVLSADPKAAELLRRRAQVDRQLVRLRTEIASADANSAALAELEKERLAATGERDQIAAQLSASNRIGALQDEPATIEAIRSALGPREAYLKLVQLYSSMAGIVVTKERTWIYMVDGGLAKTDALADAVMNSARLDEKTRRISPFAVAQSQQLFQAITGPAASAVAGAERIIYDPAGKLRQVPLAVLVTDPASVTAYQAQKAKGDYSKLAFVARSSESSVALSPRAFLRSRNDVKSSAARGKFLGIGENAAPEPAPANTGDNRMPFDCSLSYTQWAGYLSKVNPISARELTIAANAIGADGAPTIVGDKFTDISLIDGPASSQLGQYQVVHFATHGLPETQVDLSTCKLHLPPALLTTLAAPTPSGQVLSDGMLSFDEVAKLELDANLVVLSACDTAAGTSVQTALKAGLESASPALDGLVRSFIAAGARTVMATFWAVPVLTQTDDLMSTFYRTGRSATMASAIKTAQDQMIDTRRFSHPYYWGAYFLVGDGAKSMLTPTQMAMK
ncbi:CHAT domain-containing protein [Novosphingobium sp. KACC 22771]|uniref:CHAT domain-containing protein n=1 Tax=Novosphingobium sp. KACC 22771 TaxID=3025670 RepID=UPI0023652DC2|nr:CHAT domain-containing protein [Novosphingobium sp. KACC 22771]WDF74078.1 CHAT domain-containing protein [Novosphingobium sp. KACC 22771]